MRFQSMFRMNRFPLQTSYIPVGPILIDHAWLHLILSQPHYTFIVFRSIPSIPFPPVLCVCVSLFYRSPPCLVILLLLSMQDASIAPLLFLECNPNPFQILCYNFFCRVESQFNWTKFK